MLKAPSAKLSGKDKAAVVAKVVTSLIYHRWNMDAMIVELGVL